MKIKNIAKILMALIITLILATNISNAGMGKNLLADFVKNFDTEASKEEQEEAIKAWADNYANWTDGLKALESYAEKEEGSWFSSKETKEKCRAILDSLESVKNSSSESGAGRQDETGEKTETKTDESDNDEGSSSGGVGGFSNWQQQADDFLNRGKQEQTITTNDAITALLPVGKLLVGIATIVLVIVGSIMGVKYMIAGANEKAQLKQKLIYYVISVVLVYGAVGIFSMVVGLMNSILA